MSSSESSLITLPVRRHSHFYPQVRRLLAEAFPPAELIPEWVMNALALRRSFDFTAYFDPEEPSGFCGVTFTIHSDDLLFVVFLATNPALRSRGYGTRILDQLKEHFPGFAIALEIEPMLLISISAKGDWPSISAMASSKPDCIRTMKAISTRFCAIFPLVFRVRRIRVCSMQI